jgi:hypothetical protein
MILSARDRDLLELVCSVRGWVRPMDLGGKDGSHHSATLAKFVRYGWVHRRLRGGHTRAAYSYRATPTGRALLAALTSPSRVAG